jgi:hypothetical protein
VGDLYERGRPRPSPVSRYSSTAEGGVEFVLGAYEDGVVCAFVRTDLLGETRGRSFISLDWTSPNFGGERTWFLCPSCVGRAARLFVKGTSFVCRRCAQVRYPSQAVRRPPDVRRLERAKEIRTRLGGRPELSEPFPVRPKGMHWATYQRLREEGLAIEWDEERRAIERGELLFSEILARELGEASAAQRAGARPFDR